MPEGSSDGHIAALKKQLKEEKEKHQETTAELKQKSLTEPWYRRRIRKR